MFLAELMKAVVDLFKLDFTLAGFTFSFWQVFLFTWVAGILIWLIRSFLDG